MASAVSGARATLVLDGESGDHPVPGPRSLQAAEELERFIARIPRGDPVLILLSGGTSSLIAAPTDGVSQEDLARLYTILLRSGLDIHQVNRVRKRWSRFGAGRLAVALEQAGAGDIRVLAMSDVSGDRPESIGSGPVTPDPGTAEEIVELMQRAKLWTQVPDSLKQSIPDTPKPGDSAFERVSYTVVADNGIAMEAAAKAAADLGLRVIRGDALAGDATDRGGAVVRLAARLASRSCLILGGETTIRLEYASGLGGRCQQLALAAALELVRRKRRDLTILAGGTDGGDGPTDAAGAVIDSTTAGKIRAAGHDPLRFLQEHNAYPALDAVGALIRTGPTGTNVGDLVVALRM
jgi:hydroxypyruvate reductase